MAIAVGFSIHTGWAAAVVLKGPPPEVLEVLRLDLADETHDARFVYHAASEQPDRAEKIVATAAAVALERAERALKHLPAGAVLALPPAKKQLPELSAILRSHPLLHAAEGALYRNAIVEASLALGLRIVAPLTSDSPDLGKQKAPWGKDQKAAAALACAALETGGTDQ